MSQLKAHITQHFLHTILRKKKIRHFDKNIFKLGFNKHYAICISVQNYYFQFTKEKNI